MSDMLRNGDRIRATCCLLSSGVGGGVGAFGLGGGVGGAGEGGVGGDEQCAI
jgi:hypothetical protein